MKSSYLTNLRGTQYGVLDVLIMLHILECMQYAPFHIFSMRLFKVHRSCMCFCILWIKLALFRFKIIYKRFVLRKSSITTPISATQHFTINEHVLKTSSICPYDCIVCISRVSNYCIQRKRLKNELDMMFWWNLSSKIPRLCVLTFWRWE